MHDANPHYAEPGLVALAAGILLGCGDAPQHRDARPPRPAPLHPARARQQPLDAVTTMDVQRLQAG